jgi:hypothetical protein
MGKQLSTSSGFHLQDEATVAWGEVYHMAAFETWVVKLEIGNFPHGMHTFTFFGTEDQIRAIVAGPVPEVAK